MDEQRIYGPNGKHPDPAAPLGINLDGTPVQATGSREMTLEEYVALLPYNHRARRELRELEQTNGRLSHFWNEVRWAADRAHRVERTTSLEGAYSSTRAERPKSLEDAIKDAQARANAIAGGALSGGPLQGTPTPEPLNECGPAPAGTYGVSSQPDPRRDGLRG